MVGGGVPTARPLVLCQHDQNVDLGISRILELVFLANMEKTSDRFLIFFLVGAQLDPCQFSLPKSYSSFRISILKVYAFIFRGDITTYCGRGKVDIHDSDYAPSCVSQSYDQERVQEDHGRVSAQP